MNNDFSKNLVISPWFLEQKKKFLPIFYLFLKEEKKLKIKLAIKLAKIPFWLLCNTMPVVSGASHDLELKDRRKHENKKTILELNKYSLRKVNLKNQITNKANMLEYS